jgi:hypothetical protein
MMHSWYPYWKGVLGSRKEVDGGWWMVNGEWWVVDGEWWVVVSFRLPDANSQILAFNC